LALGAWAWLCPQKENNIAIAIVSFAAIVTIQLRNEHHSDVLVAT
jgi:hypothetical protein